MGLIVKPLGEKKIIISGTTIELPEIYVRLEFAARANGKTLEVAISTFASKQAYKEGLNTLNTNVPIGNATFQLEENEKQSIFTAHKYAKISLEQEGFEVVSEEN